MSEEILIGTNLSPDFIQKKAETAINQFSAFQYRVIKRAMDLLLVAVGFVPCALVGVLLAFLIRCSSSGPVFYREYRLGQYGKPFRIWKFRTMYEKEEQQRRMREAECTNEEYNRLNKHLDDPRVTPVGRILRRWSLDELPQLLNVLKGEMALIGPRPIIDAERELYGQGFHVYCMVRPGMSGLWQVSGRSKLGHGERVLLDCRYVREWSLKLDVVILFRTFHVVVTARGAC